MQQIAGDPVSDQKVDTQSEQYCSIQIYLYITKSPAHYFLNVAGFNLTFNSNSFNVVCLSAYSAQAGLIALELLKLIECSGSCET